MLRFRRDRVFLGVMPDGLSHVRFSGVFSDSIADHGVRPLAGKDPAGEIPAALETLIAESGMRGTELRITLADTLVRQFVCERPTGVRSLREIALAAGVRFEEIFGAPRADWELRLDMRPRISSQLACALPKSLLDGVVGACARSAIRLASIRPFSVSETARLMPLPARKPTIAVVVGPGSVWLGRVQRGAWQSARSHPLGGELAAVLPGLLQQERLRTPADGDEPAVGAVGCLSDMVVRRHLEAQSIRVDGAPEWPGRDRSWSDSYRVALSPVWPSCR